MFTKFADIQIGQFFIISEEASGTQAKFEKISHNAAILREVDQYPEETEVITEFSAGYEVEAITH